MLTARAATVPVSTAATRCQYSLGYLPHGRGLGPEIPIPPWTELLTDACENINFLGIALWAVIKSYRLQKTVLQKMQLISFELD